MTRDEQRRVAQLYCNGKKTLRLCAEILEVDLREMMDILRRLNIPLDGGRFPHNQLALKLLRPAAKTQALHSSD